MKKYLFLLFFTFSSLLGFSQQTGVDSVKWNQSSIDHLKEKKWDEIQNAFLNIGESSSADRIYSLFNDKLKKSISPEQWKAGRKELLEKFGEIKNIKIIRGSRKMLLNKADMSQSKQMHFYFSTDEEMKISSFYLSPVDFQFL